MPVHFTIPLCFVYLFCCCFILLVFNKKGCAVCFFKHWTRDSHQQWTGSKQSMPEFEQQQQKNSSSNETTYETAIPWSIAWVLNWNNNNIYSNLIANCTMYIAVARFSFHFVAMCVGVGVYLFIPFEISSFFWKVSSQFKYTHRNKKDEKSINPKMGTKQWNFFCKWYHRKFVFDDGIRFD